MVRCEQISAQLAEALAARDEKKGGASAAQSSALAEKVADLRAESKVLGKGGRRVGVLVWHSGEGPPSFAGALPLP